MRIRHLILFALISLVWLAGTKAPAPSDEDIKNEYKIKMAMLYNITKFTVWPAFSEDREPDENEGFQIGFFGEQNIYTHCSFLNGNPTHGRKIKVIKLDDKEVKSGDFKSLKKLHALYFTKKFLSSHKKEVQRLIATLGDLPILLIGESSDFLKEGGAICLMMVDNSIQFEVNLISVRQATLQIKTSVLKLAKKIIQ